MSRHVIDIRFDVESVAQVAATLTQLAADLVSRGAEDGSVPLSYAQGKCQIFPTVVDPADFPVGTLVSATGEFNEYPDMLIDVGKIVGHPLYEMVEIEVIESVGGYCEPGSRQVISIYDLHDAD